MSFGSKLKFINSNFGAAGLHKPQKKIKWMFMLMLFQCLKLSRYFFKPLFFFPPSRKLSAKGAKIQRIKIFRKCHRTLSP